jgi:putative SOS response-associated peptidase YedK
VVKPIRDRMPVLLLTEDDFAARFDEAALLEPTDPVRMTALSVGRRVNSPRNVWQECLAPAGRSGLARDWLFVLPVPIRRAP